MTTYTPKHLELYSRPKYYAGPDYYGYYPVAGQSRDSDVVERSNFDAILQALGGESDTVLVVRDGHWLVGWVETIYVDASDVARVQVADELRGQLEEYPLLDEEDVSRREWEEVTDYWQCMSVRDRLDVLKRSGSGVSSFAARRDELPDDSNGRLFDYLRTP